MSLYSIMEILEIIINRIGIISILLFLIWVSIHLYYYFYRIFKIKPRKLNQDSYVVIAGACLGIGKRLAQQIAQKYKCKILIIDYRADLIQPLCARLKKQYNAYMEGYACDLSNLQQVEKLISFLKSKKSQIDIFFYNAGYLISQPSLQVPMKKAQNIMNVHYFAPILILKQIKQMLLGGHFTLTSSIVQYCQGIPLLGHYISSKKAISGYLGSLRQQFKFNKTRIGLTVAKPYGVLTNMNKLEEQKPKKSDFFFEMMTPQFVASQIIKGTLKRQQIVDIHKYQGLIFRLIRLLPIILQDKIVLKPPSQEFKKLSQHNESQRKRALQSLQKK